LFFFDRPGIAQLGHSFDDPTAVFSKHWTASMVHPSTARCPSEGAAAASRDPKHFVSGVSFRPHGPNIQFPSRFLASSPRAGFSSWSPGQPRHAQNRGPIGGSLDKQPQRPDDDRLPSVYCHSRL
jgi:hypothetical protein